MTELAPLSMADIETNDEWINGLLALREESGLCATVPTEVYLTYEERAKAIAERGERETPTAIKNAILALVLEARLSGMIDGRSSQDPTNDRK
jgi:hypothetical protein